MTRYSIAEAKNNLSHLVNEIDEGPVELTRRGEGVAVVLSMADYRRLTQGPGLPEAITAFRQEHAKEIAELDLAGAFEDVRDRSPGRRVKL